MEQKQWQEDVVKNFDALQSAINNKKRHKHRELPDFSGAQHHDAEEWLDLADKLATFNKIPTTAEKDIVPEAILWMGLSMTGIAHTWYTSLHPKILTEYNEFIAAFRSFFVHINVHQHIADFHKRIQS